MGKKHTGRFTGETVTYQIPAPAGAVQMETFIPWTLVKRGVRRQVITPIGAPQEFEGEAEMELRKRKRVKDTALMRAIGLANYWQKLLAEGRVRSLSDIAALEQIDVSQVRRLLRLALIAPSTVEEILSGAPKTVTLESILRQRIPADWHKQQALLSLP